MVEEDIYNILDEVIEEDDTVLEIGSRYGTISCALSHAMNNNGRLVTVEADPVVWEIHQVSVTPTANRISDNEPRTISVQQTTARLLKLLCLWRNG